MLAGIGFGLGLRVFVLLTDLLLTCRIHSKVPLFVEGRRHIEFDSRTPCTELSQLLPNPEPANLRCTNKICSYYPKTPCTHIVYT